MPRSTRGGVCAPGPGASTDLEPAASPSKGDSHPNAAQRQSQGLGDLASIAVQPLHGCRCPAPTRGQQTQPPATCNSSCLGITPRSDCGTKHRCSPARQRHLVFAVQSVNASCRGVRLNVRCNFRAGPGVLAPVAVPGIKGETRLLSLGAFPSC